jgi:hypothetical protein
MFKLRYVRPLANTKLVLAMVLYEVLHLLWRWCSGGNYFRVPTGSIGYSNLSKFFLIFSHMFKLRYVRPLANTKLVLNIVLQEVLHHLWRWRSGGNYFRVLTGSIGYSNFSTFFFIFSHMFKLRYVRPLANTKLVLNMVL